MCNDAFESDSSISKVDHSQEVNASRIFRLSPCRKNCILDVGRREIAVSESLSSLDNE